MELQSLTQFNIMKGLFWTQIICSLLITFGIWIEYIYEADVGFLAITVGSFIFALTTKIELYYINQRKDKKHEDTDLESD